MTLAKKKELNMDKNKRPVLRSLSEGGFNNDKNFPVCRFGPGGDFVQDYWPDKTESQAPRQPIGSLLKAIAKMLDVVINEELLQDSTIEKINLAINGAQLTADLENEIDIDKSIYGEQSRTIESDAPPVAGLEADRQLQKEPLLFDNASGTGAIAGHKPTDGIRARRGSKRKRSAFSAPWQGSLFESYPQSAKVA
jgi:hypothetical protein